MKKYPVEQWLEMAMNGSNRLLVNYTLPPKNFEGWTFSHQLADQPSAHAKNTAYFFKRSRNDNDEAMRIDITEADSIKAAAQALLDMLTNVMAPMEFPVVSAGPGVVCYKGFSDVDSLLMFLRANIVVRVRSIGQKEITVLNEAKQIDAEISRETTNDDSK